MAWPEIHRQPFGGSGRVVGRIRPLSGQRAPEGVKPLTLLYTNDLHGASQPLERLESYRSLQALKLDAGDAIKGSNTAFRRHEPNLMRMARLGYHAQTMGNREFHYLRRVMRWRAEERRFPLLAANLVDLRGASQGLFQTHLVTEVDGIRVAVIGATVVQYPVGSPWETVTGFRFLDPATCLPPLVKRLRSGVDAVLFLSHLGLEQDRLLAAELEVDLILGGHSHDLLREPEKVGSTWIVQGGSHGRYLGLIRLVNHQLDYELIACREAS